MTVVDFLNPDTIIPELASADKEGVVREMVEKLKQAGLIKSVDETVQVLMEREKLGSTGIGQNIAVPHAKSREVSEIVLSVGISSKGVDFAALDGDPVQIFFLILAPVDSTGMHLKVLARIARMLKDKVFRNDLRACKTSEDIYRTIREEEQRAV